MTVARAGEAGRQDFLTDLAMRFVDLPSVSHGESALADAVEAMVRDNSALEIHRIGDNVVARTALGRPRRVVVAGHLDTVPPAGNAGARLEGDVLWGVGSADMKGTLAVMVDLASRLAEPAMDVTWCFYACEEIGREHNGLGALWRDHPELVAGEAAILGEPTECRVEAGCQGTLRTQVHLGGVRAHTARPFTGRNAIHRLGEVLDRVRDWPGRTATLDGCAYVEQLQAVAVEGGVAGNVVPDHASLTCNYRYAPDRDGATARQVMASLLDGILEPDAGDGLDVLDQADGAPPSLDQPVLGRLLALTGQAPRAKVGWTDVASFWAHGVPAVNFGAGDSLLAHHPDEHVPVAQLARASDVLSALLTEPVP